MVEFVVVGHPLELREPVIDTSGLRKSFCEKDSGQRGQGATSGQHSLAPLTNMVQTTI
jgi:hypothetical protein